MNLGCRGFRFRENAHLRRDETAPKMGHPIQVVRVEGGPPNCGATAKASPPLTRLRSGRRM